MIYKINSKGLLVYADDNPIGKTELTKIIYAAAKSLADIQLKEMLEYPSTIVMESVSREIISNDAAIILKDKKDKFFSEIMQFKKQHEGLYPATLYNQFFSYWSETNSIGKMMKKEKERFFEIGKRLATFWKRVSEKDRQKMWFQESQSLPGIKSDLFSVPS